MNKYSYDYQRNALLPIKFQKPPRAFVDYCHINAGYVAQSGTWFHIYTKTCIQENIKCHRGTVRIGYRSLGPLPPASIEYVNTEGLAYGIAVIASPPGRGNLPVRTAKSNNLPGDSHGLRPRNDRGSRQPFLPFDTYNHRTWSALSDPALQWCSIIGCLS